MTATANARLCKRRVSDRTTPKLSKQERQPKARKREQSPQAKKRKQQANIERAKNSNKEKQANINTPPPRKKTHKQNKTKTMFNRNKMVKPAAKQ